MTKRLCVVLVAMLFAFTAAANAQQRLTPSGAAIEKALENYARQMDGRIVEQDFQLKAVPRTDKAEAAVIGSVVFVDATDFLSDGTPFRIIVVHANRAFNQDVFIACLGSAFNSSCGRLALGRRVSITSDILVIEDGESAGLALFVAKKLAT
jgi:hypothetical protein